MTLSPLQLRSYFIPEFSYSANQEFVQPQSNEIIANTDFLSVTFTSGPMVDNEHKWQIDLHVGSLENARNLLPYCFSIRVLGFFEVQDDYFKTQTPEKIKQLVNVNGTSILYSAAREYLLLTTSRGPLPPMVLPSLSFINFALIEQPSKQKKSEVTKPSKKPVKKSR